MSPYVILGIVVVVSGWIVVAYNALVRLRQHCRESWSGIDTELKRRYDLIPNLVETVKGYAAHEKEVLERVIQVDREEAFEFARRCAREEGIIVGVSSGGSLAAVARKTGLYRFAGRDGDQGRIWLYQGQVVHAETEAGGETAEGETALVSFDYQKRKPRRLDADFKGRVMVAEGID